MLYNKEIINLGEEIEILPPIKKREVVEVKIINRRDLINKLLLLYNIKAS